MPEAPGEKVMKQWYQGKLAARMLQVGHMASSRAMLRRGARKQQDGTLGMKSESDLDAEGDPMQIRIGDEVTHNHNKEPDPREKTLGLRIGLAICAAALAGAAAVAVPFWYASSQKSEVPIESVDENTRYSLELVPDSE